VDLDPGLSNYLAGAKQPVEITHNTPIANLYFMASGSLPPNPAELLSGNKMVKLLELAATKFDHVIIDSPPILGLADALVISNLVDAMLLVVEAGETKRAAVEAALKRLISVRARPIGCLLTKMKQNSFSYGYGYEYYYTYGGKSRDNQKKLST
jgi:succinoglycan biosynthesis transport protein ExoP